MVFMCQLHWAKGCSDSGQSVIYGNVCEDGSKRSAFEFINSVKKVAFTNVGGYHLIH